MTLAGQIMEGLVLDGYPVTRVAVDEAGEWVEAVFTVPGGTVTLLLPPCRASASEFADLFDWSSRAEEAS